MRRGNNCSAPFSQHRKKSEKRKTERVDAESAFERELVLARKSKLNFKTGKRGNRLKDLKRDNNCSAPFSRRRRKSEKRKTDSEKELVLARKSKLNFKTSKRGKRLRELKEGQQLLSTILTAQEKE